MFTPGGWRSGPDGSVVSDQRVEDQMQSHTVCTGATPGNQALIRCAPDMYDILVDARRWMGPCRLAERIDAIITRAIGIGA